MKKRKMPPALTDQGHKNPQSRDSSWQLFSLFFVKGQTLITTIWRMIKAEVQFWLPSGGGKHDC